jgi:hypothetical protein
VSGSTVTILSAGTCTVSAAKASDTNHLATTSDPVSITVAKAAQTIAVTTPTTKTYGGAPFTISATSSAGLTDSFTSTTTESCTVTGSSVTILAAGTCTITASQAGTSNYDAATAAPVSFTISKASQAALTVVPETTSSTYDPTTPVTIALSALGGSGDGTLTYAASTPTICTVTESTVTILSAGTCTVSVSKASDTNYLGATSAGVSITITKATQTITFTQPDATTYGAGPITLSASSSAGLTVSFTSGTTSVCTVSGSSVTILAAGTCTITASQAGSSNYSAATSVPRSITINKASQAALTAVPSTSSTTYRATPAATPRPSCSAAGKEIPRWLVSSGRHAYHGNPDWEIFPGGCVTRKCHG